jgi:acetyl esterase/lipase
VALEQAGLPQPSAAVLMSPWADLTLSSESISVKAAVDPALTPEGLRRRAVDYVAAGDRTAELVSPIFAALTGLPPLLIQAGSDEILLDDATGARRPRRHRRSRRQARSHARASRTRSKGSPRCSTKPTLP